MHFLVTFVCILLCVVRFCYNVSDLRIIGGRDVLPHEFNYVARVAKWSGTSEKDKSLEIFCSCSIIAPKWALTAAHCVTQGIWLSEIPVFGYVVVYYINGKESRSNVLSIRRNANLILNPLVKMLIRNDMALLETEPIELAQYGKLSAVDYTALMGTEAIAMGYGITNDSNKRLPTHLLNKPLQLLRGLITPCEGDPMKNHVYPSVCLRHRCGVFGTACSGDSGGPIVTVSGISGIVSAGYMSNCELKEVLRKNNNMLTPISPFLDWISSVVRSKSV